jgi:glycosyltransferase involved in cell wall biosynthesis
MKKIKILHTIRQGKIGGGETHVLDLVQFLDGDVFESVVISFTEGEMVNRLETMGIQCYVIHTIKPFDVLIWKKVEKVAREMKVDLIHAHGTRACSNSYYAAKHLGIPLIYTIHGWSFHGTQPFFIRKIRELSERYLVRQSTLNIAVSRSNQEEGINRLNMPHSVVVKNGVNLNKFNPEGQYKDIRKELDILDDITVVGYIVRLTEQKDPLTFVRAIRHVLDRSASMTIRFLIVGDGELKQSTVDLANQLGISSHIIFQNFRTDVPDILNAIDIYCLPSLWEGLPIGLLEAMAMKKAIIATPVDGTREVISDRQNGLTVPVRNPLKLSEAILELYHNKTLSRQLGETARLDIDQNYNVATMTGKIEDVYFNVLNR